MADPLENLEQEVAKLLAGELSADEQARLRRKLASDDKAEAQAERLENQMQETLDALRHWGEEEIEKSEASPTLMPVGNHKQKGKPTASFKYTGWAVAAAAAVVLMVSGSVVLLNQPQIRQALPSGQPKNTTPVQVAFAELDWVRKLDVASDPALDKGEESGGGKTIGMIDLQATPPADGNYGATGGPKGIPKVDPGHSQEGGPPTTPPRNSTPPLIDSGRQGVGAPGGRGGNIKGGAKGGFGNQGGGGSEGGVRDGGPTLGGSPPKAKATPENPALRSFEEQFDLPFTLPEHLPGGFEFERGKPISATRVCIRYTAKKRVLWVYLAAPTSKPSSAVKRQRMGKRSLIMVRVAGLAVGFEGPLSDSEARRFAKEFIPHKEK